MKVFISWSGDRSRAVAELMDEWIQCVLQAVRPWVSSKDIDKGTIWFSEISDTLAETKLGIICLTKDNRNKPWILFEAGALAKGLSSQKVCTFLIDLEPADVDNPLAQLNHTMPNKDGLFGLMRTINSTLGDKALTDKVLEQVFETYWPQFEEKFNHAIEYNKPEENGAPARTEESMISEVLNTVRSLDKRIRAVENSNFVTHTPKAQKKSGALVGIEVRNMLENDHRPETIMKVLGDKYDPEEVEKYLVSELGIDEQYREAELAWVKG